MKPLRVGTTNPGKLREFREILTPLGYAVRGLEDLADFHVIEDGATFAANAVKKARAVVEATGEPAVADDSGLEVDGLGGAPGVHSARYAGVEGPEADAKNREKLLDAVERLPPTQRTARFVCALAYCAPGREPVLFHGTVEGRICSEERGTGGFGYDPLFELPGDGRTTAELSPDEKNAISHRGQALRQLVHFLSDAGEEA